jgi:hypothetical protein
MKPVLRGFLTTANAVKPTHSNQATRRSGYIIATSTRMLTLLGMCLVEMEFVLRPAYRSGRIEG